MICTAGASSRTSKTGAAGTDPARCTVRTLITSGIGEDRSTRSTGPSMVLPRRVIGLVGASTRSEAAFAVTSWAAVAYVAPHPGTHPPIAVFELHDNPFVSWVVIP